VAGAAAAAVTRVEIVPYSDRWPGEFAHVARRVRSVLGERALRIDHIGSTAVPGLAAKDRIDVQISVADLSHANPLGGAGFAELAPVSDHQPPGRSGRGDDWHKRLFTTPDDLRCSNVHVRLEGRANQRYALLFRDYLREHPATASAYAELKRRLAAELRDVGRYADVKDPACDLIMVAAEDWAAAAGWQPGVSDA
jgi:GrpB-like predicted nucleotidyltransferase (UPF0157 family)